MADALTRRFHEVAERDWNPLITRLLEIAEDVDQDSMDEYFGVKADFRNKIIPTLTAKAESEARFGLQGRFDELGPTMEEMVRSSFAARLGRKVKWQHQSEIDSILEQMKAVMSPENLLPQAVR